MLYVILLLAIIATQQVLNQDFYCDSLHPCKYRLNTHYYDRPQMNTNFPGCVCFGVQCPADWSSENDLLKIIKVRIFTPSPLNMISSVTREDVELMFCSNLTSSLPNCTTGTTALEMHGIHIPDGILSRYCICPDSNPMFIKSIRNNNISYICDSQKVICQGLDSVCFTNGETILFPCECPSGFLCKKHQNETQGKCKALQNLTEIRRVYV